VPDDYYGGLPMRTAYVPCVTATGLLVVGHCISTLLQEPLQSEWLVLAILTLFTGSFTIKVPGIAAVLSVSDTFVFASVLLFGQCAGTITVTLEILVVIVSSTGRKTREPLRVLFNVASAALAVWVASQFFYILADVPPLSEHETPLRTLLVPLAVLSTTYFLLNSGMIALAIAFKRRESALAIWRTNFLPLAVNCYAGASLAALFVTYTRTIDFVALGVIVPLLVISYLTFKMSLGRVEDATKHVDEIKHLYLSTIETLATAIDAKDQVTHGHIRRVQQLTLGLARELGVKDQKQLQALEAAALLHDTGKLVVPEHILNKPGKLTRGEFEKMKAHASVGADILSSINFPYPVVPIVRHHHENWDGTGYPDGLRSTDIPIGARILAVVDCFDALTSDRPYRPRMTDTDAMSILLQRRGVMYDPLVVDTFAACWERLSADISALLEEPKPTRRAHGPEVTRLESEPAESVVRLPASEPITRLLDNAIKGTSATLGILFGTDLDTDQILSMAARTPEGAMSYTVSMPLGSGVSGWVAVNGTPILNAEAALDFRLTLGGTELVRMICVPVRVRGHNVGVASLYSSDRRGFNEEDKTFVQQLVAGLDADEPSKAFDQLLQTRKNLPGGLPPTIH
jgi:putative nucleotidyltransferase with HDIG domain